ALPKAIICDLDGTLALMNGRDPFMAKNCDQDLLNTPVADLVKLKAKEGCKILLFSGRSEEYKAPTLEWLSRYEIPYELLRMRKVKDNRKDSIVKKEFFEEEVSGKYNIEFVLDDRNQVVDLWRDDLGLACFQVYYGDF
ncbi:MAG: polynucleotide kinase, partial [Bacteroidota bacterium]